MEKDVQVLDVTTVSESQLPSVITTQFDHLAELETNVQKAVNSAANAKELAAGAQIKVGFFNKGKAIDLLQDAAKGMADAQITMADAQNLLFKYQTKLTEISKFLFGLGISNIAMNRSVVREIEMKLKGASEEEISELAKQELRNVILQLKAQEDMMKKQEFLTGKVKEHAEQIKNLGKQLEDKEEVDDEQDEKIAENTKALTRHDEVLSEQQQKDAEHDEKFRAKDILDASQDQKIEDLDKQLEVKDKIDNAQDEKIAENTKALTRHDEVLSEQQQKDAEHDEKFRVKDFLDENQDRQIMANYEKIEALSENLSEISRAFTAELDELKNEILIRNMEIDGKMDDLSQKIRNFETISSKKIWKIVISAVAAGSLILNILQIIGVI